MLERLLLPKTYSLLEPYSEERYAAGLRCRTLCYLNLDSIISFGSLKKRKRERKKNKRSQGSQEPGRWTCVQPQEYGMALRYVLDCKFVGFVENE